MKKRLKLYFETSIWRRLVDPTDPRRKATYHLLTEARRRHYIYSSREVVRELDEIVDLEIRKRAVDRFRRVRPEMITMRPQIKRLAEEMLRRGGWGLDDLADMTHIGYSLVSRVDVLVTWDTGDLARDKTRRLAAALAREIGLPAPDIATPIEVLEEWLGIKIL